MGHFTQERAISVQSVKIGTLVARLPRQFPIAQIVAPVLFDRAAFGPLPCVRICVGLVVCHLTCWQWALMFGIRLACVVVGSQLQCWPIHVVFGEPSSWWW